MKTSEWQRGTSWSHSTLSLSSVSDPTGHQPLLSETQQSHWNPASLLSSPHTHDPTGHSVFSISHPTGRSASPLSWPHTCLFSFSSFTFSSPQWSFHSLFLCWTVLFKVTRALMPQNLKGTFLTPISLNLSAIQAVSHSPMTAFSPSAVQGKFSSILLFPVLQLTLLSSFGILEFLELQLKTLLCSLLSLSLSFSLALSISHSPLSVSLSPSLLQPLLPLQVSSCKVWLLLQSTCWRLTYIYS